MSNRICLTIMGCGSSPGVPRINGDWGNCDPENPKNRRRRPAALIEKFGDDGVTRVAIDTGPDFREQILSAAVTTIDAVIYTHPHADHIHGIDDLRSFALQNRALVDVYADGRTLERLYAGFGYCFKTPEGSSYPPILRAHQIDPDQLIEIDGQGGVLSIEPLKQIHGDIISLGFRIGTTAYCPDVSDFPPETIARLENLHCLIIDTLQYRYHPSHLSLEQSLAWIERLAPQRAVLTHMHTPLDYDTVKSETPDWVEPAFDGMKLEVTL